MRLRIEVITRATSIPWNDLLSPGRGIAYHLLNSAAPHLATTLHGAGWGPYRMVPIGHGAPVFPHARPAAGVYAAGGHGWVEFGSPLPGMIDAWIEALSGQDIIDWGGVALRVRALTPIAPPSFATGRAEFRTETPVVLKRLARTGADGETEQRPVDLLPDENGFTEALEHNLRRKAETLGMEPTITLARVKWSGAKRSFAVKKGKRLGANIQVELHGSPPLLRALWCWGIGQSNSAGFGWITSAPRAALATR